jgi:hypothetical protein
MDGHRLTHLLRPNVTRTAQVANPLATPPTTDLSELSSLSSHELDTTDLSDAERLSAVAESDIDRLSAVSSRVGSPAFDVPRVRSDDEWSLLADAEDGSDVDLADSVQSLTLDRTPRPRRTLGSWARQDRAASSPSRSPARRAPRRNKTRAKMQARDVKAGRSFYEYLFA